MCNCFVEGTGNLIFNDVIESVRRSVAAIHEEDAEVNIIIAVGHAGFNVDKRIAKEVDGVDIVVGGHTNTFLYTGELKLHTSNTGVFFPSYDSFTDVAAGLITA